MDRSKTDQEAGWSNGRLIHQRHRDALRHAENIITDKGTNFAKGALAEYFSVPGIRLDLASVAHPQSNGQVERANGLILSGIKP